MKRIYEVGSLTDGKVEWVGKAVVNLERVSMAYQYGPEAVLVRVAGYSKLVPVHVSFEQFCQHWVSVPGDI